MAQCKTRGVCSRHGRPGPYSAVTRHVQLEHRGGRIEIVLVDTEPKTLPLGKPERPGLVSVRAEETGGASSDQGGASPALPPELPSDDARELYKAPDPDELKKAPERERPNRRRAEPHPFPPPPATDRLPRKPLSDEVRAEIDAARDALTRGVARIRSK